MFDQILTNSFLVIRNRVFMRPEPGNKLANREITGNLLRGLRGLRFRLVTGPIRGLARRSEATSDPPRRLPRPHSVDSHPGTQGTLRFWCQDGRVRRLADRPRLKSPRDREPDEPVREIAVGNRLRMPMELVSARCQCARACTHFGWHRSFASVLPLSARLRGEREGPGAASAASP